MKTYYTTADGAPIPNLRPASVLEQVRLRLRWFFLFGTNPFALGWVKTDRWL
ncbi:MAG TPA: hypothetical protein VK807_23310 [Gemmatimonadaceae bacterium]|nr:hypothetical protein [Gemmatimonadaceae bacterium]